MSSGNPQLHVVFGGSAAGTLLRALGIAGRDDRVVVLQDNFAFGPIDTDDVEARAQWVETELGCSGWQDVCEQNMPVLKASVEADTPPIAWVCPDSASSVAGFLWWLSNMKGRECRVLDVPGLHLLAPEAMGAYLDQATPLSEARRAGSQALWARLQAENAPLRVLGDKALQSAPLDYFDATLLEHVTSDWQKMSLIIGHVFYGFIETGIYQTGDIVLSSRLVALAESGMLERRGDLDHMALCEMRLRVTGVPDDVIARRVFKVDGCDVECRFFKPQEDGGSFFCQVQIDWPEGMTTKKVGGVDEVQALLLGMTLAHTELLAARNIDGRFVEWLDEQSLGLPVASAIRDWDLENRM